MRVEEDVDICLESEINEVGERKKEKEDSLSCTCVWDEGKDNRGRKERQKGKRNGCVCVFVRAEKEEGKGKGEAFFVSLSFSHESGFASQTRPLLVGWCMGLGRRKDLFRPNKPHCGVYSTYCTKKRGKYPCSFKF